MELDLLKNIWLGQPALIIAGGPSVDKFRQSDFCNYKTIGTNYAHRIWKCDFIVPVKDYIYQEIRKEISPEKIVAPSTIINPDPSTYLWNPITDPNIIISPISNSLLTGKGGATSGAIHLAYLMGANPIFAIGVDLGMVNLRYHASGYWDTPWFKSMGDKRRKESDLNQVFQEQADTLKIIQEYLHMAGNKLYYLSPSHKLDGQWI